MEAKQSLPPAEINGNSMELSLKAMIPEEGVFGVKVRVSPGGEEQTAVTVDASAHTLSVDTARSSPGPDIRQRFSPMGRNSPKDVRVQTAPLTLDPGEPLYLRMFLDVSILEAYANGRQCITRRESTRHQAAEYRRSRSQRRNTACDFLCSH